MSPIYPHFLSSSPIIIVHRFFNTPCVKIWFDLRGLEPYYLSKFVRMIEQLLAEGQLGLLDVPPKANGQLKR